MSASSANSYIVAGNRPWNRSLFQDSIRLLPGRWEFANNPEELDKMIQKLHAPRYIFFLHWSHRVPADIFEKHESVCFHMTDVPYGRGGSPLQNLILNGHRNTQLTALRMVHEMDAGPVYCKKLLSLEGSAQQIYIRAGYLSAEIIAEMIASEPLATPQVGTPVVFKRRTPAQSMIPSDLNNLGEFHDFIRMLDAEGYPHAYINHGPFRLEFTGSSKIKGALVAQVRVMNVASDVRGS